MNSVRIMRSHEKIPKFLWIEALKMVVYIVK